MLNTLVQTEKISTINFFFAPDWNGQNAVVFLIIMLAAAWLAAYFVCLHYKQSRQLFLKAAWWLLFLAWLPLGLSAWLTHYNLAAQAMASWSAPLADKWQARLCRLDKNQGFQGLLCGLEPIAKAVREKINGPASLCLITNDNLYPLFAFRLYDIFDVLTSCQQADYALIYLPPGLPSVREMNYFTDSHLLQSTIMVNDKPVTTDLGRFELPQTLGDDIFLLKHLP